MVISASMLANKGQPFYLWLSVHRIMCLLAESRMHIFLVCSKAIECWDRLGIGNIIREFLTRASNFSAMMFELCTRLKEQDRILAAMTLCSLWKSRNVKLWEATNTTPPSIVTWAHDVLHEWSCMQRAKHLAPAPRPTPNLD